MAATTTAARVKKALANPEPSTHGPLLPRADATTCPELAKADISAPEWGAGFDRNRAPRSSCVPRKAFATATMQGRLNDDAAL